ncbi:P-loop containing nucleoside triphosphate hydrolase protein [Suillus paluster]|uniref:P-loop containing nucleoside triphosphate hydrolase protein n=1 Tax=Suillus paluster TaxID=48578 RepID=UPI001B873C1F|nr:P-loop containing nucleoside triphosphate hydrolase protein [Suillus paluster]KAG1752686.1 P-loop containing nucleoside triphosphate hydrolase protein [Suillus paluster]
MLRRVLWLPVRVRQLKLLGQRFLATEAQNETSLIRNMALVAHIDSGKTTLTESILHKSAYLAAPGSVDTGSTTTDFLPAERERGITIQSASIPVKWDKWAFNLIDTPGHADFGMEVESASRIVDGAVVLIDSVEGVEAQTKGVWRQLDKYGVPTRLMFLNKLDRPGASFRSSLVSLLTHRLHPNPMTLALPIASFHVEDYMRAEPGIQGLVDLVKWEIWKWTEDGDSAIQPLPRTVEELAKSGILPANHPILPHLVAARTVLLENLSMYSDELMEHLLALPPGPSSYLDVETSAIMPHLRKATLSNEILPVLCGSAMRSIGTELVMNYVGELLASPMDVRLDAESADGPLRLLAWKVSWDKRKGWMTFVRVYSGTLKRQSSVFNVTSGQKEKISKVLLLYAAEAQEVDSLPYGSVGVILGLKFTRTGDTLVDARCSSNTSLRGVVPPPAVMSASVIPKSHSDLDPVQEALYALSRTDPSVRVDMQEGQLLVHGLGALHLEIVEGRLRDEWNVNFELGSRRVSYRESLGPGPSSDVNHWATEIAGKQVTIKILMTVEPLANDEQGDPVWDGNLVLGPSGKPLPSPDAFRDQLDPMANIARGLSSSLSNSPHTSLPLSHIKIHVTEYNLPRDIPTSILAGASSSILRTRIREAGIGPVLEPFIKLKISLHEDTMGKVVKDLTENGGEVLDLASDTSAIDGDDEAVAYSMDGLYIPPEELSPSSAASTTSKFSSDTPRLKRTIHAVAPLSRMLDYSTRLRALSGGHGLYDMLSAGFRPVSDLRRLEILREIGRA